MNNYIELLVKSLYTDCQQYNIPIVIKTNINYLEYLTTEWQKIKKDNYYNVLVEKNVNKQFEKTLILLLEIISNNCISGCLIQTFSEIIVTYIDEKVASGFNMSTLSVNYSDMLLNFNKLHI